MLAVYVARIGGQSDPMTDDTVHQTDLHDAGGDDPRVDVLQAVFDRVDSWQDGADAETVRMELDRAIHKSGI